MTALRKFPFPVHSECWQNFVTFGPTKENILETTEPYTFKKWIIWHVIYPSIDMLKQVAELPIYVYIVVDIGKYL